MTMQHPLLSLLLCLCVTSAAAQSLYFTSGVANSSGNVTLVAKGTSLTNVGCVLERLNSTNQVWETQSSFIITNGASSVTLNSSLHNGFYGFFRARSTNNVYKSTNAFGAFLGYLENGYSLIGNPFGSSIHTNFFPAPVAGLSVLKWNSSTTNFVTSDYTGSAWSTNFTIGECEGLFAYNPTTNLVKCLFGGLFVTNAITKSLATGLSLITTPRYQLISSAALTTDILSALSPAGAAGLPVLTSGFCYQSEIQKYIPASGTYSKHVLSTNSVWLENGVVEPVSINFLEGFFVSLPTNVTWSVTRTIW